ncbi:hypothetical protein K2X92_04380, partial [Candidatus Gracilibacteria bacterium]|nr:hypothetical protein [Candidatus Gracilibacteria bacterium]
KTAFADVKGFMKANFDDVENFDDLQSKVGQIVSDFGNNLETHLENAKKTGISKKEEITQMAQEFLQNHEATLDQAKTKAASFVGVSEETIDTWLDKAKTEIADVYQKVQAKFDTETTTEVPKKTTTRKPAPKKTTESKSE